MKKYALYIVMLVSVLVSSCSSIQTLTFDQLAPAQVNFPYQVSVVGVVNNMPSRPKPKKNILTLGMIDAEGKSAAEALAGSLADSKFFNQVIICDSALCADDFSTVLTADEVNELSSMLGVDMLVSFERLLLDVEKKEYTNPGWDVSIPVLQVQVTPIVRLYIPGRQKPLVELTATDSLYFDMGYRVSEKEVIEELQENMDMKYQKLSSICQGNKALQLQVGKPARVTSFDVEHFVTTHPENGFLEEFCLSPENRAKVKQYRNKHSENH